MPQLKKAELIEGIVYVASPLRFRSHGTPHAYVMTWLGTYVSVTPGVELGDNPTVRLDAENEPQPDGLLRLERRGQSIISEDDYVEGAPELIVEIAASSAAYDLHEKKDVYCRNQVQEYLVWQVYDRAFSWFCLQNGQYVSLQPDAAGFLRSRVFPGLWLNPTALIAGDLAIVLAGLQQGLTTPEHQIFVQTLSGQ